jgi:hypothetical protein
MYVVGIAEETRTADPLLESEYGRHERLELLTFPASRDALSLLESKYGRHEETRTPDLYRVKVAL